MFVAGTPLITAECESALSLYTYRSHTTQTESKHTTTHSHAASLLCVSITKLIDPSFVLLALHKRSLPPSKRERLNTSGTRDRTARRKGAWRKRPHSIPETLCTSRKKRREIATSRKPKLPGTSARTRVGAVGNDVVMGRAGVLRFESNGNTQICLLE